MTTRNFAARYAEFRGGWFLAILAAFMVAWIGLHALLPSFDSGLGILNVILSCEASISVGLLIQSDARNEAIQRRQLEFLLHLMEANHAVLVGLNARGDDSPAHSCMVTDAEKP